MPDVLVLGAGVAGLLITHRLAAAGVDVRLLEARDRIGGRTVSVDGLDLGASWVWDSERHVHALIDELGISLFEPPRGGLDLYDGPDGVQRGRLPSSAVPEKRVIGGTAAIAHALAKGLDDRVRLASAATALSVDGDAVCVHVGTEVLRARHVVAALPPAVLASRVGLPDAVAETVVANWRRTGVWMADVAKVVAVYPRAFWRAQGLSGRVFSARGPMSEVHDLSGPDGEPAALFGFVHRTHATGDWQGAARAQLARLYGDAAGSPTAWHAVAWWTEPFTAAAKGAGEDLSRMGHPSLREPALGGRLHLCSTETSAVSPGHIEGAVERAEAVAKHLIAAMA